jgi:uncharacterized protein (TIGR03437 family)
MRCSFFLAAFGLSILSCFAQCFPNLPIQIAQPSTLPDMEVGVPYSYQFRATGGTTAYFFFVEQGSRLPAGLELSLSGELSGKPITARSSNPFTIFVREMIAGQIGVCQFQVAVLANRLAITSTALPRASVGLNYSATLQYIARALPVRFELLGGSYPPGLQGFANGLISGTPTTAGTYTMRFRVVDANNIAADGEVTLIVEGPSLRFETSSLPGGEVGLAYSSILRLAGNPQNASFQVLAGQLPPGLSLLPNGSLSGTPTSAGDFTFTVRGASAGATVDAPFTIRIAAASGPLRLMDWPSLVRIGLPFNSQIPSLGARGELRFTLLEGVVPAGLVVSSSGQVSGTPRVSGSFTQRWRATDASGASAERRYSFNVEAARAFPNAVAGQRYSQRDGLAGGSRYVIDPTSRLPLGLRLEPDGTLSGTPFAAGEYLFLLRVDLGAAPTQTLPFRLSVVAPATELELDTLDLPAAIQNRAYRQPILTLPAATSLRMLDGELPPGLVLGTTSIEGTPTTAGFWEFLVDVRSGARSTSRRYSISVGPALAPQLDAVVNSASYQAGAVAAGEILTLFGSNLDGIRASIDGGSCPILYATPTQSSIIVPFASASKDSVELILERAGLQSIPLRLRITNAKPGIYTQNGSGLGPAAALNQDGSLNTELNPAAAGSVVVVYATGLGELETPAIDGSPAATASLARVFVDRQLTATLNGEEIPILYAGSAPGLIHGAAQLNLQVPSALGAGKYRLRLNTKGRQSPEVEVWVR